VLAGQEWDERSLPYPHVKNDSSAFAKQKEPKPWTWVGHRKWCQEV
jgi:hypothetical protein